MAWRRPGGKLLSEPMMVGLSTHTCVIRPQWVKTPWKKGSMSIVHGPLTRYVNLRVAHASWMRNRLKRKPLFSNPDTHHGTCVAHVPWCMSGSLTCGGGENVPGSPGACATRKFIYLAIGPLNAHQIGKPVLCQITHCLPTNLNSAMYNIELLTFSEINTLIYLYLMDVWLSISLVYTSIWVDVGY